MKQSIVLLALSLLLFGCSTSLGSNNATGRWQSPTTSSGSFLWLRLNDNSGTVSGTLGSSSNSSSGVRISGTRVNSYLDLTSLNSGANFYFAGSISGDTWEANSTVCSSSCSGGTVRFTRTSNSAAASIEIQGSQEFQNQFKLLLEQMQK